MKLQVYGECAWPGEQQWTDSPHPVDDDETKLRLVRLQTGLTPRTTKIEWCMMRKQMSCVRVEPVDHYSRMLGLLAVFASQ